MHACGLAGFSENVEERGEGANRFGGSATRVLGAPRRSGARSARGTRRLMDCFYGQILSYCGITILFTYLYLLITSFLVFAGHILFFKFSHFPSSC